MEIGDRLVLVFGQHFGEDLVDAELGAHRVGDLASVAGDHHHADAQGVESIDRFFGFGPDLIFEREGTDDLSTADDMEHRGTACPPLGGAGRDRVRLDEAALAQQRRPADGDRFAVDVRLDAAAGDRAKVGGLRHDDAAFRGRGHDGPGERVLAVGFHRGGEREDLVVTESVADDAGDGVLAGGERAGLVEEHRVDGAHALERESVLDQGCRHGRRCRLTPRW